MGIYVHNAITKSARPKTPRAQKNNQKRPKKGIPERPLKSHRSMRIYVHNAINKRTREPQRTPADRSAPEPWSLERHAWPCWLQKWCFCLGETFIFTFGELSYHEEIAFSQNVRCSRLGETLVFTFGGLFYHEEIAFGFKNGALV